MNQTLRHLGGRGGGGYIINCSLIKESMFLLNMVSQIKLEFVAFRNAS